MTGTRRRFQSNGDAAVGVFRRIGDQLVDDEAERDAERGRYLDIRALDHDGATGLFLKSRPERSSHRRWRYCLNCTLS